MEFKFSWIWFDRGSDQTSITEENCDSKTSDGETFCSLCEKKCTENGLKIHVSKMHKEVEDWEMDTSFPFYSRNIKLGFGTIKSNGTGKSHLDWEKSPLSWERRLSTEVFPDLEIFKASFKTDTQYDLNRSLRFRWGDFYYCIVSLVRLSRFLSTL